jgi:hypothetical protein
MNNEMRGFLLLIAAIAVGFAACNYTDGECWYYGEGSENAGASVGPGGGVIIPTGPAGVGGYGDEPPKGPLDAPNPDPPVCNIVSLSPCHEQCDAEDEARAIECAKIIDEPQRRACIDSSYEKLKSCVQECETRISIVCTTKCAVVGSGNHCTGWVTGEGTHKTESDACKAAKKNAASKAPAGCTAKHCKPCDCD